MRGFLQERMELKILRSNSILLWGPRYKEVRILHRPELIDGEVMELLVTWRGWETQECENVVRDLVWRSYQEVGFVA